ncbi:MAG: hypothetical protein ACREDJ_02370 [Methylocella sp.]
MDLKNWLCQWLGIHDLREQITQLDGRMGQIETHVTSTLQHFGGYRNRTDEELTLMRSQLETMLATISNVIEAAENQADIRRAARLKKRLKYKLTKVYNAMIAKQLPISSKNKEREVKR